jgi:hypothetical protein
MRAQSGAKGSREASRKIKAEKMLARATCWKAWTKPNRAKFLPQIRLMPTQPSAATPAQTVSSATLVNCTVQKTKYAAMPTR